jgi:hypothetical protein
VLIKHRASAIFQKCRDLTNGALEATTEAEPLKVTRSSSRPVVADIKPDVLM